MFFGSYVQLDFSSVARKMTAEGLVVKALGISEKFYMFWKENLVQVIWAFLFIMLVMDRP